MKGLKYSAYVFLMFFGGSGNKIINSTILQNIFSSSSKCSSWNGEKLNFLELR